MKKGGVLFKPEGQSVPYGGHRTLRTDGSPPGLWPFLPLFHTASTATGSPRMRDLQFVYQSTHGYFLSVKETRRNANGLKSGETQIPRYRWLFLGTIVLTCGWDGGLKE